MKRSLRDLKGHTLETKDGLKGKVKDFLSDDTTWVIRFIEADFGNVFKNERVLLPMIILAKPLWDQKYFPIGIDRKKIENCPKPEENPTVSRDYEKALSEYYGYENYWNYDYNGRGSANMFFPPRPLRIPSKVINEKDLHTNLRSFQEVKGYHINAIDGKLGHIEDLIIDDIDCQITYVIVDTSNWRPWSKKVMLSVNWLEDISYVNLDVSVNLHAETIKEAPEADLTKPLDLDYEKALVDYYENQPHAPS